MGFKHLFSILLISLSGIALAANHGGPGKHQMGHGKDKAHKGMHMLQPMPNLMRVVVQHGDQLNLNKDQSAAFAKWRELNHDKVHSRMEEMLAIRKALQVAATKGANLAAINVYVSKMDKLRAEIIAAKVACRDNMRRILNDEQWDKVIALYRENHL